jgi:carbohydrate-binding DOMON domain-containing protein
MATATFLAGAACTINSVDLSDQLTNAVLTYTAEALEATSLADVARKYVAGLQNNEITVTLMQSYAATETEATVYNLVGTTTTIVLSPTAAGIATPSASSPRYTLSGAYLASHTPITSTVGELSMVELTFQGGTLAKATS